MKSKFKALTPGEVLGESQYYTVISKKTGSVLLLNDLGEKIEVSESYVDACLDTAEQFSETKECTKTALAEIFLSFANHVMSVVFLKQIKPEEVVMEITKAYEESTPKTVQKAIMSAVKKGLEGEARLIVGRHSGGLNELGRVQFVDMKLPKETGKAYDTRLRQVDPRTIQSIVVGGIKYILK